MASSSQQPPVRDWRTRGWNVVGLEFLVMGGVRHWREPLKKICSNRKGYELGGSCRRRSDPGSDQDGWIPLEMGFELLARPGGLAVCRKSSSNEHAQGLDRGGCYLRRNGVSGGGWQLLVLVGRREPPSRSALAGRFKEAGQNRKHLREREMRKPGNVGRTGSITITITRTRTRTRRMVSRPRLL